MSISFKKPVVVTFLASSLVGLGAVGCGDDESPSSEADGDAQADGEHDGEHHDGDADGNGSGDGDSADADVGSKAADLRVALNLLLSEHLVVAAKATGAALGGRTAEYEAYGALLNSNGTEIGALVGQAFGSEAETQFNGIWSAHNGFFVDYTTGVAGADQSKQDQAVQDLTELYVPQFAALISGATGLPVDAVTELTTEHVLTTKAIVDAQAAEDWPVAFEAIRSAFAHMAMIGDPLSVAIAGKLPEAFPGDAEAASVDLRVALNQLLQEHMYLASFATGAALGGRNDEFAAAGDALSVNGTDLGAAVGSLYGGEAETQFNGIWSAHNGFFVDYTTGVASDDAAKRDEAVRALTESYVPEFAAFLAGATDLPEETLASLTSEHVLMTKAVVDLQSDGDAEAAASADRASAQHMQMIADPLATAIVAKLPDSF